MGRSLPGGAAACPPCLFPDPDTVALLCLPESANSENSLAQAELPRPVGHAALKSLALVASSLWPNSQLPGAAAQPTQALLPSGNGARCPAALLP